MAAGQSAVKYRKICIFFCILHRVQIIWFIIFTRNKVVLNSTMWWSVMVTWEVPRRNVNLTRMWVNVNEKVTIFEMNPLERRSSNFNTRNIFQTVGSFWEPDSSGLSMHDTCKIPSDTLSSSPTASGSCFTWSNNGWQCAGHGYQQDRKQIASDSASDSPKKTRWKIGLLPFVSAYSHIEEEKGAKLLKVHLFFSNLYFLLPYPDKNCVALPNSREMMQQKERHYDYYYYCTYVWEDVWPLSLASSPAPHVSPTGTKCEPR